MMEENSKLFDDFNEKKRRVQELRNQLNIANEEKEKWFEAKTQLNSKISALIKELKQDKSERDGCTSEVRAKKADRENVNTQIRQKIEEVKSINKDKKETTEKYNLPSDPSLIKRQIDALETKIETEVMGFQKEKEIMKRINELRKVYDEAKKLSETWSKAHALSKEIDTLKKQSDEVHQSLQTKAKESQSHHESLVNASEEIKKLSKDEKDAFDKFIDAKKRFTIVNDELKKELGELNQAKNQINEVKTEDLDRKRMDRTTRLQELEKEVQEKFKAGKKLTTEDLLIIQEAESKKN